MTNVIVEGGPDRVSVVVPPSSIKVSYDVGRTGRRGSIWFSGSGAPGPLTLPEVELFVNDMYMDSASGWIWQYVLLPNNVADWVKAYQASAGGGGGGAVSSVAGRTGDITLAVADLTDAASLATDTELSSGLATKANTVHSHPSSEISDSTATGRSLITATDAAAARTAIGAGTSSLAIGTTGTTAAAGNRQATATAIGMVELATTAEATTGTDTTRAVTPAGLKAVADTKAPALGADDNYVTDSEKTKLANLSGVNTGDQDLSGYALLTSPGLLGRYVGVNAQVGTTYTPVLSDEGKLVTLTNAAAITVTLPQDSDLAFPVGARTDYAVLGEGMVTFVAGTGATVKVADTAVSRKTNSSMTAVKIAANTWLVVGDLA